MLFLFFSVFKTLRNFICVDGKKNKYYFYCFLFVFIFKAGKDYFALMERKKRDYYFFVLLLKYIQGLKENLH